MEIKIKNLSDTPISEITRCFNESFSDYFVKFSVDEKYLETRWAIARVKMELSFGCFIDGTLRGFMVHGIDFKNNFLTAFNCATGIEPPFRGQGILGKMYAHAFKKLNGRGIFHSTLEVISINKKAIRAYEKAGFKLNPTLLHCFKNSPKITVDIPQNIAIKIIKNPDYKFYKTCRDFEPTWEMTNAAIRVFENQFEFWEIEDISKTHYGGDKFKLGYLIFAPFSNSIIQIAILPFERKKNYGKMLMKKLLEKHPTIRINNVPATAIDLVSFLKNIEMENHIDQYEMNWKL